MVHVYKAWPLKGTHLQTSLSPLDGYRLAQRMEVVGTKADRIALMRSGEMLLFALLLSMTASPFSPLACINRMWLDWRTRALCDGGGNRTLNGERSITQGAWRDLRVSVSVKILGVRITPLLLPNSDIMMQLPWITNLSTLVSGKVYRSWYLFDLGYIGSNTGSGCGERSDFASLWL